MIKNVFPFAVILLVVCLFACKDEPKSIKTEDIKFTKEGELSIFSLRDSLPQKIRTLDIELAENDYERETGLMYRTSMEEKQGMLFIFPTEKPQSFYMRNTLIPLDIIYIDDDYKIVSFQKNAEPLNENSLPSGEPAKYVLEINAGLSDRWKLTVGDSISFSRP